MSEYDLHPLKMWTLELKSLIWSVLKVEKEIVVKLRAPDCSLSVLLPIILFLIFFSIEPDPNDIDDSLVWA